MTTPYGGTPAPPDPHGHGHDDDFERAPADSRVKTLGIIALVLLLAIGAWAIWFRGDTSNDDSDEQDTEQVELTEDIKRALTIADGDELKCGDVDANGLVSFKLESKEKVVPAGPRLWSDSLGLPVNGEDAVRGLNETQYVIWHGPDVGVTYAHFFAKLSVGDMKLVELNPWLADYNVDDSQINDQAASFLLVDNPNDDDYKNAHKRNKDYQELACKVNTLLDRFHVAGIAPDRPSTLNYRLKAGGLSIGPKGLSEVESTTDVDRRPAIVLELTSKTAKPCEPVFAIGINVGDKRPELFAPAPKQSEDCVPKTTTPKESTPSISTTPNTTTTTPSTSTTTKTTETTPSTSTSTTTTTTSTTTTTTSTTTTETSPPKNPDGGPDETRTMTPPPETDAETIPPAPPETPLNPEIPTTDPTVDPPVVDYTPSPVPSGLPSETVTTTIVDPGAAP